VEGNEKLTPYPAQNTKENEMASVKGDSTLAGDPGVFGENLAEGGAGVYGRANANGAGGVIGHADNGRGVYGESPNGTGVWGWSKTGNGAIRESNGSDGILGLSNAAGKAGVAGVNENGGNGLYGRGDINGVFGHGNGSNGTGVVGISDNGVGVLGKGGRLAGLFEGDVEVTGDIQLGNADCAEDFNIGADSPVEPGSVMVLGEESGLLLTQRAYDKRVAGVVSGAGSYKPGIVLDKQQSVGLRQPIALLGKVYCKVDAQYGAIEVGDLLTTSPTLGHAMKADDPVKAVGAVIGKALQPCRTGVGLIPILVTLQ
jgi:hypothetical protein